MKYYCVEHGERLSVEKAEDGWPIFTATHPGMAAATHCHLVAGFRAIAGGADPTGTHRVFFRRHGHPVYQECRIIVEEG